MKTRLFSNLSATCSWWVSVFLLGGAEPVLGGDIDPVLRGEWPGFRRGPARGVAVAGHYAYVTDWGAGLQIIDVSNPASPRRVGGNSATSYAQVQATADGRIFAAGPGGLTILQMLPFFRATTRTVSGLELSREGFGNAQLERATRLDNPDWTPLLGSERTNCVTLPVWGGPEFFRLMKP